MKLRPFKAVRDYEFLLSTPEFYLGIGYFGFRKLDKKTFEPKGELVDFFGATSGFLSYSNRYLILRNHRIGLRVYDLNEMRMTMDLPLMAKEPGFLFSCELSPKEDALYVLMGDEVEKGASTFLFNDFSATTKVSLRKYSFPDGKLLETIPCPILFLDICYVPFLNTYLLLTKKDKAYYQWNGKDFTPYYDLKSRVTDLLVFNNIQKVATVTEYGIKLFNEKGREINKFDLISDDKEKVSSAFLSLFNGDMPELQDEPDSLVNKEKVLSIKALSSHYVVCLSQEIVTSYSRIAIYDLLTGKMLTEQIFGVSMSSLNVLEDDCLAFTYNEECGMIKIENE